MFVIMVSLRENKQLLNALTKVHTSHSAEQTILEFSNRIN